MKPPYDQTTAERMRPLLESILVELNERFSAVRMLERRVRVHERRGQDEHVSNLVAEVANHKRELRLVEREAEALGCEVEVGLISVLYVPGPDGRIESGFQLSAAGTESGEVEVEAAGS